MGTICGADCSKCGVKAQCGGCLETGGRPFGGNCVAARCCQNGGGETLASCQKQLAEEFNGLGIRDMPEISRLFPLNGFYVNLEYALPNGQSVKLLKDDDIYLGCQVEKAGSQRCYGLVADDEYLLVCEYGSGGADPEIVVYKRRRSN